MANERDIRIASLIGDCMDRRLAGEDLPDEAIVAANPGLMPELAEALRKAAAIQAARIAPDTATQAATPRGQMADLGAIPGYEIIRVVGRGGQGVVYEAVQERTNRRVAIKVQLGGQHAGKATQRRFEREIELVAKLRHPYIVSIFHADVATDGNSFAVMDFIEGLPLDRHVRECELDLPETLELFSRICEAVQYAHHRGVIHRDLKPSNILVEPDGTPRILDFGLAVHREALGSERLTLSEQILGTLPYMSPEQARGDRDDVDVRSDVYALGVILYQLLTGKFPYPVTGKILQVLRNIEGSLPTPPQQAWTRESGVQLKSRRFGLGGCPIGHDIQTIVLQSLAKEPGRRYQGAGDLAADVQRYLAGEPIEAKRDSFWYVVSKLARRNIGQAIVAASVLLILGSAGAIAFQSMSVAGAEQRKRAESEATLAYESGTWAEFAEGASAFGRAQTLTVFLDELSAGRETAARHAFSLLVAGSPTSSERRVAEFVLTSSAVFADLLKELPKSDHGIAYLAQSVRSMLAGDAANARNALIEARSRTSSRWWQAIIDARLLELKEGA